ncbi:MAG: hypothetical protein WCW47_01555 [Candidatus Paceibacterota bacterium]|jgi:ABC-type uncharacterized transport system ATPase subunit
MNEGTPKSAEELKGEAIIKVTQFRDEVVGLVGICGDGTHPLTEALEELEALQDDEITPERINKIVGDAENVKDSVCDFR